MNTLFYQMKYRFSLSSLCFENWRLLCQHDEWLGRKCCLWELTKMFCILNKARHRRCDTGLSICMDTREPFNDLVKLTFWIGSLDFWNNLLAIDFWNNLLAIDFWNHLGAIDFWKKKIAGMMNAPRMPIVYKRQNL